VLHDEELLVILGEMIAYLREHRMPKTSKNPGLPFERVPEHFVAREERPLYRDRAAQTLIHRKINLAHPAFPDQLNYQISALYQRILG